jgi:hypothetical protein
MVRPMKKTGPLPRAAAHGTKSIPQTAGGRRTIVMFAALAAIVLLGFLLRLSVFDFSIGGNGGDGMRDYLVASHIVNFQEFVLTGDMNGTLEIKNGPLYYYALALPLLFFDHPLVLGYFFVLLQSLLPVLVFLMVRAVWDDTAAILAALFAGFTPALVGHSAWYIWSPYVMELFLAAACALLAYGYSARRMWPLILGASVAVASATIHNSAFAVLPVYMALSLGIVYALGRKLISYALVCGSAALTFVAIYTPLVLQYARENQNVIEVILHSIGNQNQGGLQPADFISPVTSLLYRFTHSYESLWLVLPGVAMLWYFLSRRISVGRKVALAAVCVAVLANLAAVALFGIPGSHYIVPILFLIPILLVVPAAALIHTVAPYYKNAAAAGLIGIVLFALFLKTVDVREIADIRFPPENFTTIENAAQAILAKAETLKESENRPDISFFDIAIYRTGGNDVKPASLWIPLERVSGIKFTTASDNAWSFEQRTFENTDYIFLGCTTHPDAPERFSDEECLNTFGNARQSYTADRDPIFNSELLTVFLARRAPAMQQADISETGDE